MALNPSLFQTTTPLQDFSIRAANDMSGYIADEVFTPVIVSKTAIKVYQYDLSQIRQRDSRKASGAEADLVDYAVFTTDRTPVLNKFAAEYDPADTQNFDAPVAQLQQDAALIVMDSLMLSKEVQMATKALTATNYPAALTSTLSAGSTWLDSGGDPEGNSATARSAVFNACLKPVNAAAMSYTTFNAIRAAPYFVDRMKFTQASVTEDGFKAMLKAWLGVEHLHICMAKKTTAVEGNATQTVTDVWDDSILFYVKSPGQSLRSMRYGASYIRNQLYTFQYQVNERGSGDGRIQRLEMGWWYSLEAGAVVSSSDTDFTGGYLLKNVI